MKPVNHVAYFKPVSVKVIRKTPLAKADGDRALGWYRREKGKKPWIEIDSKLSGVDDLTILIHECIHHAFPYLCEEEVVAKAFPIAKILWEDKWRREDESE